MECRVAHSWGLVLAAIWAAAPGRALTHSVSDLGFHSVPEAQGACLGSGTRSSLLSWGGPRRESGGRGLRSLRLWG